MPYFLSKPISDAITTLAQSVSGINPILTSFFSGASEPAAQALVRQPASPAAAPAAPRRRKSRRVTPLETGEALFASLLLPMVMLLVDCRIAASRILRSRGIHSVPGNKMASILPGTIPNEWTPLST